MINLFTQKATGFSQALENFLNCAFFMKTFLWMVKPGTSFLKAPETSQARKAIFSSSVSRRGKCSGIRLKLLV